MTVQGKRKIGHPRNKQMGSVNCVGESNTGRPEDAQSCEKWRKEVALVKDNMSSKAR